MKLLEKLPRNMVLSNGVELVLDMKKHSGINDLCDIQWYEYKIINGDVIDGMYDNVCLSGFIVTEEIRKESEERIIEKNVSLSQTVRPHIDYKTGNIHPSKEYIRQNDDGGVKQLVLCSGLGPITPNIEIDDEVYFYKNRPRQRACRIHKACYYPLIHDEKSLKYNWRYEMLSEIWQNVQNAISE